MPRAAHAGTGRNRAQEELSKKESRWRLTCAKYVDINLNSQAELDALWRHFLDFNTEVRGTRQGEAKPQ
ncbi:hypothetical protein AGR9A_Cc170056 [Agrobacterium salinitolerans str. Hayward 0363]|nr:hypothetical protein AGR9A_Cc170056 [Agrobacterium salinitolerans str. Hayward 0363]